MSLLTRPLVLMIAACLSTAPVSADDHATSPAEELAERYGIDGWDQIASLEFTFNVELPNRRMSRAWNWEIVDQAVTRRIGDDAHRINLRSLHELWSITSNYKDYDVHKQFINDTYWLLFPFQLVWSDPTVTDAGPEPRPLGDGTARKLTCQWPAVGGYTPGDAYDLYLGDEGLIKQWVFRRGGGPDGNAYTWDDHRRLGPIAICLDFHGDEDSGFRLWFTDVRATLVDGTVVTPQPMGDEP